MFGNIFLKTLHDQRRAIVGWSVGILLLVSIMGAVWPSVRDMPDLEEFLESYPEAFRELFNLEDFATGTGYMNAELFSLMLPVLFIIFAIGRGARLIAGEEEDGTLEVLLVTPVSPTRLVLHKAAALAVAVVTLGVALLASTLLWSAIVGMGIGVGDALTGALSMVLLGIEFGWLALAVGAISGRRATAIGVAGAIAVAAYVLYAVGQLIDAVEPWQPLSPFYQALNGGPLGAGLPATYGWLILGAVVVLATALPTFDRRDIAVR